MSDYEFSVDVATKIGTTIKNKFFKIFIYEFVNKKKNATLLHFQIKPLSKRVLSFDLATADDGEKITVTEVGIDSDLGMIFNKYDGKTGKIDVSKELWVDTYDLAMPTDEDVEFIEENVRALIQYLKTDFRHVSEGSKDYGKPWRYAY